MAPLKPFLPFIISTISFSFAAGVIVGRCAVGGTAAGENQFGPLCAPTQGEV